MAIAAPFMIIAIMMVIVGIRILMSIPVIRLDVEVLPGAPGRASEYQQSCLMEACDIC